MLRIDDAVCTGTHIGNGVLLTAAHCLLVRNRDSPDVEVLDNRQKTLVTLESSDYLSHVYPLDRKISVKANGRDVDLPIPDIALIVPKKDSDRSKIGKVGRSILDFRALDTNQNTVSIAGYGVFDYDDAEVDESLRAGTANIADISDDFYSITWEFDAKDNASAAAGDSCGPLFVEKGEKIYQYGVASTIRRKQSAGVTMKVQSNYSRLDDTKIRSWIEAKSGLSFNDQSNTAVTPGLPTDGRNEVTGTYKCKSKNSNRPYYVFKIDLNNELFRSFFTPSESYLFDVSG